MANLLAAPVLSSNTHCELRSLSALSNEALIKQLSTAGATAASARFESDRHRIYDETVEALIGRADVALLRLLIAHTTDETLVTFASGDILSVCAYDAPVRVKHKVRFILDRVLNPDDHRAIVRDSTVEVLDRGAASAYLARNSKRIERYLLERRAAATKWYN